MRWTPTNCHRLSVTNITMAPTSLLSNDWQNPLFFVETFLGITTKRKIIALNFSIKEKAATGINLILQAAA